MDESGLLGFQDGFYGENLRLVGVSRWATMDCSPTSDLPCERCPADLDLRETSAGAWTCVGGTVAHGPGGMTIVPTGGATSVELTLELAGWGCPPCLYAAVCEAFTPRWTASGVSGVSGSIVSALGGTKDLGPLASGTRASLPRGNDLHYAGSWGIENGAGFTSDLGMDALPAGDSAAAMGDASRVHASGGLRGKGGASLRLTIQLGGSPASISVGYPTLHRASGAATVVNETGSSCAVLFENGPAMRFGNWDFYVVDPDDPDGEGVFTVPPAVEGLGHKSSAVDGICWRRAVLQGVSPEDGGTSGTAASPIAVPSLADELALRYDAVEGRTVRLADRGTISFPLPSSDGKIRLALVNTLSESAPLALLPTPGRDAATWKATGARSVRVWDLCKEPRDVVSPVKPLELRKPDGALVSAPHSAPAGWKVERYRIATENDEPATWRLAQGGTTYARVRPWHGWFWVGGRSDAVRAVAYDVGRNLRHYRAAATDAAIETEATGNVAPFSPSLQTSALDAAWLRVRVSRVDRTAALWAMRGDGTTVLAARSVDEGATFEPPMLIGTGKIGDFEITQNGPVWFYWVDGSTVFYALYNAKVTMLLASGATNVVDADGEGAVAVRESVGGQGAWRMGLYYTTSGGERAFLTAPDGKTFT